MATRRAAGPRRARRAVPRRVAKHVERLGLYSAADYVEWCRSRGLRPETRKSWSELLEEWSLHTLELAEARARGRVDRDPCKLLVAVCAGAATSRDIARPRWRMLAERVERARVTDAQRDAARVLFEAARHGSLPLAERRFGDRTYPYVDGLIALSRRHREWIRSPREWRPRSHNARRQFASLARHLLARYPVPGFMDAAWLRADGDAERYRDWFIRIGRGANIRTEASPLPLTRRIVHHFLRAPSDYAIEHALRWGQVHALGGSRPLVEALVATRLGERFEHDAFWSSVIRFFVRNPSLGGRQVGPIVDYLYHQRFHAPDVFVAHGVRERLAPPQPNLSMKRRSAASLVRQVERWHGELARAGASARVDWAPSGIGALELETGTPGDNLQVWRIRELLSAEALQAEGRAMRHCAAMYTRQCVRGDSSIWTMEVQTYKGIRKRQTLEVRDDGVIAQCRGRGNSLPGPRELCVLRRWAAQEGLTIGRFVAGR